MVYGSIASPPLSPLFPLRAPALLKRNKKGRPGKYCQNVFSFFGGAGRRNGCDGKRVVRARILALPDELFRIVSRMNPVPYLFSLDSLPTFCTHHPLHSLHALPFRHYLHHSLPAKYTHAAGTLTRARDEVCSCVCALNTYALLLCINTRPMELTRI